MGLGKIIGIIIAIPVLVFTLIPMFIQFFAEGIITDALMSAFGINPIIGTLVTVGGTIIFLTIIITVSKSVLGL